MSSVSSSIEGTKNHGSRYSFKSGCCNKGNWSGMNIAAMVVGFVLFWPIGLVVLYWNIKGRDVRDLPRTIQQKWSSLVHGGKRFNYEGSRTDNSVFNEFQQTQYDRISEIKEEITNRTKNFSLFREDAKRRKDEKEFNEFNSRNPDIQ